MLAISDTEVWVSQFAIVVLLLTSIWLLVDIAEVWWHNLKCWMKEKKPQPPKWVLVEITDNKIHLGGNTYYDIKTKQLFDQDKFD